MSRYYLSIFSLLLFVCSLSAHEQGDFLIRGRLIHVWPDDSSGSLSTNSAVGVTVGHATMPEVDFTYMFTDRIGTELILATTPHTIKGTSALAGTKIATGWLLPPTLTAQFHFLPCSCFQPYVGVGINYTFTYGESCKLANTKASLNNSFGLAGQAGFDVKFNDCWFFNVDVKYIDLDLKATLTGATIGTVKFDVNPWIIGAGLGRRF